MDEILIYNTSLCCSITGCLMSLISLIVFLAIGLPTIIKNDSDFNTIYSAWINFIILIIGIIITIIACCCLKNPKKYACHY